MCGIALVVGERPSREIFSAMMAAIAPRGDVTETLSDPGVLMGTERLRIVDRDHAVQPWLSADGRWALCYNGEVFNYLELREELAALGHDFTSVSDTEVVLEAFLEWGMAAVEHLRGEFAFAIVERQLGRTYLARDPVGVKPLYFSLSEGTLYVASEVKALVAVGAPVQEVAPGHHGWAEPGAAPSWEVYLDLLTLGDEDEPIEDHDEACAALRSALVDSIAVRVKTDLPVGVILSGGLDSTLTLLYVRELHPDCVAFTIGAPDSEDLRFAKRVAADLGVQHEVLELRPRDIGYEDIKEAVRIGELTEYGDVINAVVSNRIFERIHQSGVKVVLSGDGSDELFGGYDMYDSVGDDYRQRLFQHNLRSLSRTELQRVDRTSMSHAVECRVPFLDLSLVRLAMRVPIDLKVRDGQEKWILRHAFADVLPKYVIERRKNPLSHSSGLHERIRLYRSRFPHLYRSYGYELSEPMRRDFSIVLERNGLDLDRALASQELRQDYSTREHLRDLAGALRWNVTGGLRRMGAARTKEASGEAEEPPARRPMERLAP